ncbi:MAG: choice-of-anchor L domain-containing protein [Chloroflexota bacterium]
MRKLIGGLAAVAILMQGIITTKTGEAQTSGLSVQDIAGGQTASALVSCLLAATSGVTVSNVSYTGASRAAGSFSSGTQSIIGFSSGILLGTGSVGAAVGPNTSDGGAGKADITNNTAGDNDLASIVGGTTYDAAVLQFDMVPVASPLTFRYVFASEEYKEYVNSQYNDRFALFVNGTNIANIPGTSTAVAINSINHQTNSAYYRDNPRVGGTINTEMDGLTTVFTATTPVNVGATNHVKLAIADAGDRFLDSNVFFECGSFSVLPTPTPNGTSVPGATATPVPTLGTGATSTPVPSWQLLFAPPATETPTPTATPEPEKDPKPRKLTEEQKQQVQRTNTSSLDDVNIQGDVIEVRAYLNPPELVIANLDGLVVLKCYEDAMDIARDARPGDYFVGEGDKNNEQEYDVYKGKLEHTKYSANR